MRSLFLLFIVGTFSVSVAAQVHTPATERPLPLMKQIQSQWQVPLTEQSQQLSFQPLSKQFTHQMMQPATGDRELVQVYDSIYYWDWDLNTGEWSLMLRHIDLQFDDNYTIVGSNTQLWTGSDWQNYVMTSQSVSDDGQTITSTQQVWVNNAYVNDQRMIQQLGVPNWPDTIVTIQNWTNGAWVNEYRWTIAHHDHGALAYELDQVWLDGEWVNTTLFEYFHEGWEFINSGILISEWVNDQWLNVIRYTMTYYPDNTMSGKLEEFNIDNFWVNSTKDTLFTYNDLGSNTGYTRYIWTGDDWMNMYKIENTYDSRNNRISNLVFQWMNSWSLVSREISNYTYDENNFIMGESVLNYEGSETEPLAGDSTNYIYHTVITGSGQVPVANASIAVWPNPGKDVFNISSNEVIQQTDVYDINGHLLRTIVASGQSGNKIDLTEAPNGVYILKVLTESGIYLRKIMKQ